MFRIVRLVELMNDYFYIVYEIQVTEEEWRQLELSTETYTLKRLKRKLETLRGDGKQVVTNFFID